MGFFDTPPSEARLARVERKLDALIAHFGIEVPDNHEISPHVRDAIDQGKKIEAITRYRADTGAGLKESKDIIETYF